MDSVKLGWVLINEELVNVRGLKGIGLITKVPYSRDAKGDLIFGFSGFIRLQKNRV